MAQLPTLSLCNGFSANGLPLSMQFAARSFDKVTAFRVGHAYETATPWRARRPVVPATPIEDGPADQSAPSPAAAMRATYAMLVATAALILDERQFAQICEAMPHVEALAAALPHDLGFAAELANTISLVGE